MSHQADDDRALELAGRLALVGIALVAVIAWLVGT